MDEKPNQPLNLKFPKQPTENPKENHIRKPQLAPDTKRKRKRTETIILQNKQTHEKHTAQLFLPQAGRPERQEGLKQNTRSY